MSEIFGYRFKDAGLLEEALTHPSVLQEKAGVETNQRLEFLGDAVLQIVISERLFREFPEEREGSLSRRRAAVTRGVFLARLAKKIGVDGRLKLGGSEEASRGREKEAALEDAFEAVVGAVFLDGGFEASREFVLRIYQGEMEEVPKMEVMNPKGALQELVQAEHGNEAVRYETEHVSGEDHERRYLARVFVKGKFFGEGTGSSKKLAEEAAARAALGKVGK